jgi:sugar phosphate isomerase/epimerase
VTSPDQTPLAQDHSTPKALHTWSLFRTMGRFVARGSMPTGDLPERQEGGLSLLELPAELARHGYVSAQLCHFYLPTLDASYLDELRSAFADAGVLLECFLIDDGDLAHPVDGDAQQQWVSGWLDVAEALQAQRARVVAGKQAPEAGSLSRSAERLVALAGQHRGVRVVTENWHAVLPDAASVDELLDRTEGEVGFLIDLGNWKGPGKYAELAQVAGRAETCQAKVSTTPDGAIDPDDYRASLGVLRDAGYAGPLAMVHDGPDDREWNRLEDAYAILTEVFG